MSESKHTPGPWVIARSAKGYPYQIDAPNGSRGPGGITSVTRWAAISLPTSPEGEANARLIAAAPEMLAALRSAEMACEQLCEGQHPGNQCWVILAEVRAAIAKAREAGK